MALRPIVAQRRSLEVDLAAPWSQSLMRGRFAEIQPSHRTSSRFTPVAHRSGWTGPVPGATAACIGDSEMVPSRVVETAVDVAPVIGPADASTTRVERSGMAHSFLGGHSRA